MSFLKNFYIFTILHNNFRIFLQKCKIWKTQILINLVVSLKVLQLHRCTIPHFKALDQLFWPLAWLLILGEMVFEVWSKRPVRIIIRHPLLTLRALFIDSFREKLFFVRKSIKFLFGLVSKWVFISDIKFFTGSFYHKNREGIILKFDLVLYLIAILLLSCSQYLDNQRLCVHLTYLEYFPLGKSSCPFRDIVGVGAWIELV